MIVVSTEIYTFTFFTRCLLLLLVGVYGTGNVVHTFGFVSCQSRVLIFFLALLGSSVCKLPPVNSRVGVEYHRYSTIGVLCHFQMSGRRTSVDVTRPPFFSSAGTPL